METKHKLFYEVSGPAKAPAIVWLHGGGAAGWMWRAQVGSLSSSYRCLTPDLPEQGKSIAAGPFSHALAAELVAELIRDECGGRAHVVGLSEGAQVTVELLARTPELVDHAVISSAILRPVKAAAAMSTPSMIKWSYRLAIAPFKNWDWWIRLNMRYAAGIPEEFFSDFKLSFQQTTENSLVNMLSAVNYRIPVGLERAQSSCLVVTGSKEYPEMHQSARDLLSALPHSRGAMITLGSKSTLANEHNWAMTAPGLFTRTVQSWIEDRPLPEELLSFDK